MCCARVMSGGVCSDCNAATEGEPECDMNCYSKGCRVWCDSLHIILLTDLLTTLTLYTK